MSEHTKQEVHLSHSQIEEFSGCPRRYHLHRRLKVPPDCMPSALLFGIALHEALALLNQKRLEGKAASLAELHNKFLGQWKAEQLPVKYSRGEHENSLKAMARRMIAFYLENPACCGDVLAVEEPFRLRLSASIPPVLGRIDLVERSPDGGLVVVDFKSAKSRKEPAPEQLVLYREAARAFRLAEGDRVSARFVVLLKTKEPAVVVYEPEIVPQDLKKLITRYEEVWKAIQAGVAYPVASWRCGGCQWQRHCDASDSDATGPLLQSR